MLSLFCKNWQKNIYLIFVAFYFFLLYNVGYDGGVFMDKIFEFHENLILNQLENLSLTEFDTLFDMITKEELQKGLFVMDKIKEIDEFNNILDYYKYLETKSKG